MRNDLCQAILDCGSLDLNILDDVEYDFYEIVERLRMEEMPVTLGSIVTEIFLQGIDDIKRALSEEIEETEIDLVNARIDNDEALIDELEDKQLEERSKKYSKYLTEAMGKRIKIKMEEIRQINEIILLF